ncbi:MAG: glycosyltransferase [Muribaculaceae bacterium]|nr:glycosyltransferase [Muribaculaceae bacterium]
MATTLDVAIATYMPAGIERVAAMNLPQLDGVRYIVSWQEHQNAAIPKGIAERGDIEVYRFDKRGLSLNRNNAIAKCKGDIILLADDDVEYTDNGLQCVINTFESNPRVDVATFKSTDNPRRSYPKVITPLGRKLPKGYYVCSIEIALRRDTAGDLRCHPELGLGAPKLQSGEDELLLHTAIKRGLHCTFFPITICNHPAQSTGSRPSAPALRGAGCIIAMLYPWTCAFRLPLKAWRVSRCSNISFMKSFIYLCQGAICAPEIRLRGKQYL